MTWTLRTQFESWNEILAYPTLTSKWINPQIYVEMIASAYVI